MLYNLMRWVSAGFALVAVLSSVLLLFLDTFPHLIALGRRTKWHRLPAYIRSALASFAVVRQAGSLPLEFGDLWRRLPGFRAEGAISKEPQNPAVGGIAMNRGLACVPAWSAYTDKGRAPARPASHV